MVNPGGTGSPSRVISARFAPLPPSSSLRSLLPSANAQTYFDMPASRSRFLRCRCCEPGTAADRVFRHERRPEGPGRSAAPRCPPERSARPCRGDVDQQRARGRTATVAVTSKYILFGDMRSSRAGRWWAPLVVVAIYLVVTRAVAALTGSGLVPSIPTLLQEAAAGLVAALVIGPLAARLPVATRARFGVLFLAAWVFLAASNTVEAALYLRSVLAAAVPVLGAVGAAGLA